MTGAKIEPWRKFFRDSEHDLWTIIDKALTIAALDFPDMLKAKRDGYAVKLFARPVSSEAGTDIVCRSQGDEEDGLLEAPEMNGDVEEIVDMRSGNRDAAAYQVDEEIKHVVEIRKELSKLHDKTDEDVLEFLTKLTELQLSIETLKTTGIGKPVNALRKHTSVQIRSLAKKLVRSWKALADEWANRLDDVQVTDQPAEGNDEEFGLPAPPVDEGELFAALEMPQFIDLMDSELASSDIINTTDDSPLVQVSYTSSRASHSPASRLSPYNNLARHERSDFGPSQKRDGRNNRNQMYMWNMRPGQREKVLQEEQKSTVIPESAKTKRATTQNLVKEEHALHRLTSCLLQQSHKLPVEEYSIKDRLAAAKRKLQEGYQQAETAKKQRTVQVMDLVDLPKGPGPKAVRRGGAPSGNNNRGFVKRW